MTWGRRGPRGPAGPPGATGPAGSPAEPPTTSDELVDRDPVTDASGEVSVISAPIVVIGDAILDIEIVLPVAAITVGATAKFYIDGGEYPGQQIGASRRLPVLAGAEISFRDQIPVSGGAAPGTEYGAVVTLTVDAGGSVTAGAGRRVTVTKYPG